MPTEPRAVLLDTHTLLWLRADGERLSSTASSLLASARVLLVSPLSLWEVGMLVKKGRVVLDRATITWTEDVLSHDRVQIAEVTPQVAVAAAELQDFHGDPADRVLVATAMAQRVPFLTKDGTIHEQVGAHPGVDVRW